MSKNTQTIVEGPWEDLPQEILRNALVVFSPTTVKKVQKNGKSFLNSAKAISAHQRYDDLPTGVDGYSVYVGFGGGTAIDLAKYLSHRNPNSTCIAIPSMLSTNVFATNKTAAIYTDHKETIDSKLPDIVLKDNELLKLSWDENLYGLADAFSIHTAMRDWLIADEDGVEPVHLHTLGWDMSILYKAQQVLPSFDQKEKTIDGIFNVLLEAGYITNDWGCGRPESGSEHIVAKSIEELVNVPHGLSVTCGIAIVSQLQDNFDTATRELIRLGMYQKVKSSIITPEVLADALKRVQPRPGRYTVIDRFVNKEGHLEHDLIADLISGSQLYD